MAVCALRELDSVSRLLARRNVALLTRDAGMARFQRIRRGSVLFRAEPGRLETLYGMTRSTLTAVLTGCKLAAMRVRTMAVATSFVGHGLVELPPGMAGIATNFAMFAEERVFGS